MSNNEIAKDDFPDDHGLFPTDSEGVLVIRDFLSEDDFNRVQTQVHKYARHMSKEFNERVQRKQYRITEDTVYRMFSRGYVREKLHDAGFTNHIFDKTNEGIDYRFYCEGGFMHWHKDVVLFDPPQYEVVFTLHDDSDCRFVYKSNSGNDNSIKTEPNSAVIVRAGGVTHRVARINRGTRSILKLILRQADSTELEEPIEFEVPESI